MDGVWKTYCPGLVETTARPVVGKGGGRGGGSRMSIRSRSPTTRVYTTFPGLTRSYPLSITTKCREQRISSSHSRLIRSRQLHPFRPRPPLSLETP